MTWNLNEIIDLKITCNDNYNIQPCKDVQLIENLKYIILCILSFFSKEFFLRNQIHSPEQIPVIWPNPLSKPKPYLSKASSIFLSVSLLSLS